MKKFFKFHRSVVFVLIVSFIIWTVPLAETRSSDSRVGDSYKNQFHYDSGFKNNVYIHHEKEDLIFIYGQYSEILFNLDGHLNIFHVEWKIVESTLPPGLNLEDSQDSSVIIFGTPRFTDQWCFNLSATINFEPQNELVEEVCIIAKENNFLQYPKFLTGGILSDGRVMKDYSEAVFVDRNSVSNNYIGEFIKDNYSVGNKIQVFSNVRNFKFDIRGFFDNNDLGVMIFVLKLTSGSGVQTYKQFRVMVNENYDNLYSCPPGYYFDDYLDHCAANTTFSCPVGTYWEVETSSCRPWPEPLWGKSCRVGYYFDHFLGRCVFGGYPRCPLNYKWDTYYNRCVRLPYSCSYGERYSYILKECVPVFPNSCSWGYHYDYYLNRCVRNYNACSVGYYWNYQKNRCLPRISILSCGSGKHWSSSLNRCVSNYNRCQGGDYYDYHLGRCVGRFNYRRCQSGYHWDSRLNSCVRNHKPRPRPQPIKPAPAPRPRPRPQPIKPVPAPAPRPQQVKPAPAPAPRPQPIKPAPAPRPRPQQVKPAPAPRPRPQQVKPAPAPRPQQVKPAPAPAPRPQQVKPAPAPAPRPRPRPQPIKPAPAPRPREAVTPQKSNKAQRQNQYETVIRF